MKGVNLATACGPLVRFELQCFICFELIFDFVFIDWERLFESRELGVLHTKQKKKK